MSTGPVAQTVAGSRAGGGVGRCSISAGLHWVGGLPIHDATNSFRLYSRRLLDAVTIESSGGFELGIELTVKAHRLRMRIAEVPTTWRDRTAGQSRFRLWQWLPRYLRWYWLGIAGRLGGNKYD